MLLFSLKIRFCLETDDQRTAELVPLPYVSRRLDHTKASICTCTEVQNSFVQNEIF
jgi:hypothetical protein